MRGRYRPSPGSVYPTLQMLEDLGYVTSTQQEGKKVYAITDEGRRYLHEQQSTVDDIRSRIAAGWDAASRPEVADMMHELQMLAAPCSARARAGRCRIPSGSPACARSWPARGIRSKSSATCGRRRPHRMTSPATAPRRPSRAWSNAQPTWRSRCSTCCGQARCWSRHRRSITTPRSRVPRSSSSIGSRTGSPRPSRSIVRCPSA